MQSTLQNAKLEEMSLRLIPMRGVSALCRDAVRLERC